LTIQTPQGPAEIMLVDLAGADPGESLLNRQMQSAARQAIDRAELVIHCVPDEPAPASPGDRELLVRTKSDLASTPGPPGPGPPTTGIAVSAVTGAGITTLLDAIAGRLADRAVSLAADALALEPRHEAALRGAQCNLDDAIELVHPVRDQRQLPQPELVAAALRLALDDLATLAGDVTPDDVLGRIFTTFCVGK
jgi:tRNA modification GTPase